MDPLPTIEAAARRIAASYGLEVLEVQFRRERPGWVLRVVLDRVPPLDASDQLQVDRERRRHVDSTGGEAGRSGYDDEDGVTLLDCQRVSEELSAMLDVEDLIDRAYTLEVSSPGLDRPLRHEADYRRFAGRLAKIVVAEAVEGQTHFEGRLRGVEHGRVVMDVGRARTVRIPLDLIRRGRLEVEF